MDFVTSTLSTAFAIASAILAVCGLLVGTWLSSVYIGSPLGVLVSKYIDLTDDTAPKSESQKLETKARTQKFMSGFFGMMVCSLALFCEILRIEHAVEKGGVDWDWRLWLLGVVFKGVFEGLIALGIVSGVVRLAGLG